MERLWFNNHEERNDYIENKVWRHIVSWILCLVLPFTVTYVITCMKFISEYKDSEFVIAFGLLIFIIIIILCVIYALLKECERLIKDLKSTRVSKSAEDY